MHRSELGEVKGVWGLFGPVGVVWFGDGVVGWVRVVWGWCNDGVGGVVGWRQGGVRLIDVTIKHTN